MLKIVSVALLFFSGVLFLIGIVSGDLIVFISSLGAVIGTLILLGLSQLLEAQLQSLNALLQRAQVTTAYLKILAYRSGDVSEVLAQNPNLFTKKEMQFIKDGLEVNTPEIPPTPSEIRGDAITALRDASGITPEQTLDVAPSLDNNKI